MIKELPGKARTRANKKIETEHLIMGVILGIDIGGSSTKIVGLSPDLSVIDMLRVKAEDPLTSLYGAMGNFLSTHQLQLSDIRHIALTGVGSSYVEGDIYGVKTIKVEEFPSVGTGGLALSGKEHAVVVSMGTGTSFLWANKGQEVRHLIGSGVGGSQRACTSMRSSASSVRTAISATST